MSIPVRASGPSVAIIRFDPATVGALREAQRDHLAYHFRRLIVGEGTALAEWRHLGIAIEVETDSDQGPEA